MAREAGRQVDSQNVRLELHALGSVWSIDQQTWNFLRTFLERWMKVLGIFLLGRSASVWGLRGCENEMQVAVRIAIGLARLALGLGLPEGDGAVPASRGQ